MSQLISGLPAMAEQKATPDIPMQFGSLRLLTAHCWKGEVTLRLDTTAGPQELTHTHTRSSSRGMGQDKNNME